jgi:hypothetical protein
MQPTVDTSGTCSRQNVRVGVLYSSGAARTLDSPSQPTIGQPLGRVEKGGNVYLPSQLPSVGQVRLQRPNTLQ